MALSKTSRIRYQNLITNTTTIAASGSESSGNTTDNKYIVDLEYSDGNMSLFIKNDGDSTDITVTYQIGVKYPGTINTTIDWYTPDDGGDIPDLTNVDINNSKKHVDLHYLAKARYYKFTITNNDGVNSAIITATLGISL